MRTKRLRQFLAALLGIAIGLLVIFVLNWLFFGGSKSGCLTRYDNSVDEGQVFLMGTIGGEYEDPERDCWREEVVQPVLEKLGVTYFNPVVSNWSEEDAEREARAIAAAETIVLVITDNSPSIGSLSESGWALVSAIERDQTLIAYINPESEMLDSERARLIVLSQARPLAERYAQFILVDSLDEVVQALRDLYNN